MRDRDAARMVQRAENYQLFYGWFDDPTQTEPTYSPPLDAPCPLCGHRIESFSGDVRTHNLMYVGAYAKRSYFYRTHKSCAEKETTGTAVDGFILDMIKRNGD